MSVRFCHPTQTETAASRELHRELPHLIGFCLGDDNLGLQRAIFHCPFVQGKVQPRQDGPVRQCERLSVHPQAHALTAAFATRNEQYDQ
jgi:hypothetical protein